MYNYWLHFIQILFILDYNQNFCTNSISMCWLEILCNCFIWIGHSTYLIIPQRRNSKKSYTLLNTALLKVMRNYVNHRFCLDRGTRLGRFQKIICSIFNQNLAVYLNTLYKAICWISWTPHFCLWNARLRTVNIQSWWFRMFYKVLKLREK